MKNICIILLFFHFFGYSQNVSFDEITFIKNKDITVVKDFLISKSWFVFSDLEPTKNEPGIFVFALESEWEEKDGQDFATNESFISYHFDISSLYANEISFKTGSEKAYNSILRRIEGLNYVVVSNYSTNKSTEMVFSDGNNLVKIVIYNGLDLTKYYEVTLMSDKSN